jgi:translation elongation factor EF-1alpha
MDDDHFSNIPKINKILYLIILGETKTCNSTKIGHILCNKNKISKDLMNAFLN